MNSISMFYCYVIPKTDTLSFLSQIARANSITHVFAFNSTKLRSEKKKMTPIFTSISLFTITLTLTLIQFTHANSEGDALYTLKRSLTDPDNVLQSWDPTLVCPCTWFHVTCNQDNRVTRVYFFCLTNFFVLFLFLI